MEMEVKNDTFYVLETGNEKRIYDTEGNAIQSLKRLASKNKDIDPESMRIVEVNTAGEKWEIKSVPWSKIAIELIRGG
ncbi:MAG: hypothetical protein DDT42_01780 [candidate division WS2 bacterium]|uniref:Uncharacterized protein n=1 Tax=Psychracetigena formicireducens TaxID=2986056 RepID=A0A9E2F7S2_PSYF1|nr:hypothetical protein [Candidatus Psychracetigena formicireducens]